jgi:hypothetical protein
MNSTINLFGLHVSMERRSRRRALVVCLYILLAALFVFSWRAKHEFDVLLIFFIPFFNKFFFGGGPYAGGLVAPFTKVQPIWLCSDPPPQSRIDRWFWARAPRAKDIASDERDRARRDRAHMRSHVVLGFVLYLSFSALWLHREGPIWGEHLISDNWAFGLIIIGVVLSQTLPQAILLWTEPDMEEPQKTN